MLEAVRIVSFCCCIIRNRGQQVYLQIGAGLPDNRRYRKPHQVASVQRFLPVSVSVKVRGSKGTMPLAHRYSGLKVGGFFFRFWSSELLLRVVLLTSANIWKETAVFSLNEDGRNVGA